MATTRMQPESDYVDVLSGLLKRETRARGETRREETRGDHTTGAAEALELSCFSIDGLRPIAHLRASGRAFQVER